LQAINPPPPPANSWKFTKGGITINYTPPTKVSSTWDGYVKMETAKKGAFGVVFNNKCAANTEVANVINEYLLKNGTNVGKSKVLHAYLTPIYKAIGAAANAGGNTDAKFQIGAFFGIQYDYGFTFGKKSKASASTKTGGKVKVSAKTSGKTNVKAGGKVKVSAKTSGKAKTGTKAKASTNGKAKTGGKVKVSAGGKAKTGVKVNVKAGAKTRRLQAITDTKPTLTVKVTGVDITNAKYNSGLEQPTELTHVGMKAVASANLMTTMIAVFLGLIALF